VFVASFCLYRNNLVISNLPVSEEKGRTETEDWLCMFQAADFRRDGARLRRKMWYQNMKMKLIVLGIIVALILIIILSVCHGRCGK